MPQKPKPEDMLQGLQENLGPNEKGGGLAGLLRRMRAVQEATRIPGVTAIDGYLQRRAERKLAGMVPRD